MYVSRVALDLVTIRCLKIEFYLYGMVSAAALVFSCGMRCAV